MSSPKPLPTFTKIGKYSIEGLISRGGMSLLYLASDPETASPIIVKVLLPKFLSEKDVVNRFLNEAHIISLTDHPNIVRLVDSGRWEGGLYIAMEFIKGSSLKKIFQHQPYTLKRAMDVLLQISYAIAHLHAHGVVHGDLKPENILINEHGQVKVIDFGIATVLSDDKQEMPARFLGTPIYMSPELGIDRSNLSFQSDIFALGIIAYELAIGKISHGRVSITLAPKGIQKVLQKALQPNPTDRYQDMCDFIADLSTYIKSSDLEKDKQGTDQFLEVFEKLELIQQDLLPQTMPEWDRAKVDIAFAQGMGPIGLYIDYFELSEHKKVLFACVSKKPGAEGLIGASSIRAVIRTLLNQPHENTPMRLLKHIESDVFTKDLSFAYLVLDTEHKSYSCWSTQYGIIALFSKDERLPKILTSKSDDSRLDKISGTYNDDDKLLFIGTCDQNDQLISNAEITKDTLIQSSQNQAEAILRKIRLITESSPEKQPLSVILVHFLNSYGKKLPPLK